MVSGVQLFNISGYRFGYSATQKRCVAFAHLSCMRRDFVVVFRRYTQTHFNVLCLIF